VVDFGAHFVGVGHGDHGSKTSALEGGHGLPPLSQTKGVVHVSALVIALIGLFDVEQKEREDDGGPLMAESLAPNIKLGELSIVIIVFTMYPTGFFLLVVMLTVS